MSRDSQTGQVTVPRSTVVPQRRHSTTTDGPLPETTLSRSLIAIALRRLVVRVRGDGARPPRCVARRRDAQAGWTTSSHPGQSANCSDRPSEVSYSIRTSVAGIRCPQFGHSPAFGSSRARFGVPDIPPRNRRTSVVNRFMMMRKGIFKPGGRAGRSGGSRPRIARSSMTGSDWIRTVRTLCSDSLRYDGFRV